MTKISEYRVLIVWTALANSRACTVRNRLFNFDCGEFRSRTRLAFQACGINTGDDCAFRSYRSPRREKRQARVFSVCENRVGGCDTFARSYVEAG
jgi:hypothetical protein